MSMVKSFLIILRTLIAFAVGRSLYSLQDAALRLLQDGEAYRTLIAFATERFAVERSFHSL